MESDLDALPNKIAKGAQVRSWTKWISEGERNTNFFLGLEKKHQTNNTIYHLIRGNETITCHSYILKEMSQFNENLYQTKKIEDVKYANI